MILLSFALVLVALGMLVAGLFGANQGLIWASIGASVIAGLCLVATVLQQRRSRPEEYEDYGFGYDEPMDESPDEHTPTAGEPTRPRDDDFDEDHLRPMGSWGGDPQDRGMPPAAAEHEVPMGVGHDEPPPHETGIHAQPDDDYYEDPVDEPGEEDAMTLDEMRYVDFAHEVLVIDGRPRYHLDDCPHLRGKDSVGLALSEAREAGFTPCSLCRPNSTLVARATR